MPNGQVHLMVNLAEDEFRTYRDQVRNQCPNRRVLLWPARTRNPWSSIRERNAGLPPSSFDTAEPLGFSRCP